MHLQLSKNKLSTIAHFIVWLLIVPPGLLYLLSNYWPEDVNLAYLFLFIIFSFLTVLFPIKLNGQPVSLVMWVTLPAFLLYGVAVEAVVMQLAIVAAIFSIRSNQRNIHRLFFNSTMMFILSVLSAIAFYFIGGQTGSMSFWLVLICATIYRLLYTFVNFELIKMYMKVIRKRSPFSIKDIIYEYATAILVLPLALTFYALLNIIGVSAFLLLGLPFFSTLLIIRLHGRSEKVNHLIKKAGDIGVELSIMNNGEQVTEHFIKKTSELFNADFVFLFDNHEYHLELSKFYNRKRFVEQEYTIHIGEGVAGLVFEKNDPIIYSKRRDWEKVATGLAPDEMESILCIPITHNNKIEGILLLGSKKKSQFKDFQLRILDLLGSYYIVSTEKAKYMQEVLLRSERCALTKLYNYRYLEEQLQAEISRMEKGNIDTLSVVIVDVDHFKSVNDSYGHQSGNDILYELSRILENVLPENGTVGRYGGEEFVFILPGFTKEKAFAFAEDFRKKIKHHPFKVTPDLFSERGPIEVFITVSIGVSNAPVDTDEAMTLLRNADRALYLGAKQAGRDRVAEYVK